MEVVYKREGMSMEREGKRRSRATRRISAQKKGSVPLKMEERGTSFAREWMT